MVILFHSFHVLSPFLLDIKVASHMVILKPRAIGISSQRLTGSGWDLPIYQGQCWDLTVANSAKLRGMRVWKYLPSGYD